MKLDMTDKQRIEAIINLHGHKVVVTRDHDEEDVEIDVTTELTHAILDGLPDFEMTLAFGPDDPQDEYDVNFEFDTKEVYEEWAEKNLEVSK